MGQIKENIVWDDHNNKYKNINLQELEAAITTNLNLIKKSFITVGFLLRLANEKKLYEEAGYKNIYEYASDKFGLSRSSAWWYMAINAKYSKDGFAPELDERYKDFDKCQLQEMFKLPEDQLEHITPDMTILQIRETKKALAPIKIAGYQCTKVDEWTVDGDTYILGNCIDNNSFYCANIGSQDFEFDHKPTREEIESRYFAFLAMQDIEPEPEQEEQLSFFKLPKTVRPEGSLIKTPGCGNGKYDCFACCRDCEIRQEDRYCRTAPMENPFPCKQMKESFKELMQHSLYKDQCQILHQELAPVTDGDQEPNPCCLNCEYKSCFSRCDIAKNRDEDEQRAAEAAKYQKEQEREAARPEPSDRDIKAFYDFEGFRAADNINANDLKAKFRNAGGGGSKFDYQGSARGCRINYKREITWTELTKRLKVIQEQEREAEEIAAKYAPSDPNELPDDECQGCLLNNNAEYGDMECHPERGEHKCYSGEDDEDEDCATSHKTETEVVKHDAERFTLNDGNGYGWTWSEVVKAYLFDGYKSPHLVTRFTALGAEYTACKNLGRVIFYDARRKLFEVEIARLQKEYEFYMKQNAAESVSDQVIDGECIELPEEPVTSTWPDLLSDMPVFARVAVRDYLDKQEHELREYQKVEATDGNFPEALMLKKKMAVAGARLLLRLVEAIQNE